MNRRESSTSATVLIVDDEPYIADLYRQYLVRRTDWTVLVANSGPEALDLFDESVDVVLLDRRMPGMSGDAVLERIRAKNGDCRVAMLTAVDPGFDIVEMGFDEYVSKPVDGDTLVDVVTNLLGRSEYSRTFRAYYAALSKLSALEGQFPLAQLVEREEYHQLVAEVQALQRQVDGQLGTLGGFEALKELPGGEAS